MAIFQGFGVNVERVGEGEGNKPHLRKLNFFSSHRTFRKMRAHGVVRKMPVLSEGGSSQEDEF